MKIIRILLLVLLSALLPIRGVMAAALPCAGATGARSDMHAMHSSHGDQHDEASAGAHAHMGAGMGQGQHHHEGATGQDTCNLCSACCTVPPLASAVPGVPVPHALASVAFPDLATPVPSFLSEGQERPPRSI